MPVEWSHCTPDACGHSEKPLFVGRRLIADLTNRSALGAQAVSLGSIINRMARLIGLRVVRQRTYDDITREFAAAADAKVRLQLELAQRDGGGAGLSTDCQRPSRDAESPSRIAAAGGVSHGTLGSSQMMPCASSLCSTCAQSIPASGMDLMQTMMPTSHQRCEFFARTALLPGHCKMRERRRGVGGA